MSIATEPIYAALFALLPGAPTFVTKSRRLKHWNDVPAEMQPALFQWPDKEVSTGDLRKGEAVVWTLHVDLYVYTTDGTEQETGSSLFALRDAIEAALRPPAGSEVQTLGGLVEHCRVMGAEYFTGALGAQAQAILPVQIVVAFED